MKLMIVEDENKTRAALRECVPWSEMGFTSIEEAVNGQNALETAQDYKPDIVLTDIKMPVMDGIEFAQRLLSESPDTNIIIISAYTDIDYFKNAIKFNAVDYLLKPVQIDELKAAVMRAVERYKKNISNRRSDSHTNKSLPILKEQLFSSLSDDKRYSKDELLYKLDTLGKDKPVPTNRTSRESEVAKAVKDYIQESYGDIDLTVNQIAEKLYYTSAYVCMVFKQFTGVTVNDYINMIRIQKAKELLKDKHLKLLEIAMMIGYSNDNYFSKVFKKFEGITPAEYRKSGI